MEPSPLDAGRPYTLDRIFRLFMAAAILVGLIWLLAFLSDVLFPFAVALILAYMLDPLVRRIQRLVRSRGAAVALSLLLVFVVLAGLVAAAAPVITSEVSRMGRVVGELVSNSGLAQKAAQVLPADLWQAVRDFLSRPEVKDFFTSGDLWTMAGKLSRQVMPGVWKVLSVAGNFLLALGGGFIILLYLVFLLLDLDWVRTGWPKLLPARYREPVREFGSDFLAALNTYFRGQAAVAGLVGVLMALGFWLIGLPLGILLGLLVGVLNMVPYLQLIALPPAFLLALLQALETGQSIWGMMGLTAGVFVVVQVIQDAVLVPRIMGKVTGLNPAVILLSLSIWGKLLGLFGLLIAIPLTVLFWAYYQRLVTRPQETD